MIQLALSISLSLAAVQSDTVPLYDNLGDHHHAITTRAPLAQKYFDQGLRLVYGFNHAEAIASFRQALRFDAECAMCWWGIALASGPNINAAMDSAAGIAAYHAATMAVKYAAKASAVEQAFIRAIATRYGRDPLAGRAQRDSAYARAMQGVALRFAQDDDAATLFADALMNLSPWVYWLPGRQPRQDTPDMLAALERVMGRNPKHAGACHLYIHAVEAAFPERAEACADRLAGLMPGAGHIVHMPGHIYIRVGRWQDALKANQHAIHEDETFIADRNPAGAYPLGYYPHNHHFLNFVALMAADQAIARESAAKLAAQAKPDLLRMPGLGGALQHYLQAPLFVALRFEDWRAALVAPAPPADLPYPNGLWHYARGVAYARLGDVPQARAELTELRKAAETPALKDLYIIGYNSARTVLAVATATLEGEIAVAGREWDVAIARLRAAAALEDAFVYIEPPEWPIPVRHNLGRAQLLAGHWADARAAFEQDLQRFPENIWSLRGLAEALVMQGDRMAAAAVHGRIQRALEGTARDRHVH
jgi:tetratricopeptide (TPR) repeat protein